MPPVSTLDFDVHDLPMDVFDLTVSGLEVQTLTLGRGYDIVNWTVHQLHRTQRLRLRLRRRPGQAARRPR